MQLQYPRWGFTRLEWAFGLAVWAVFTLLRGYAEGCADHFEFANAAKAFAWPDWLPNDLFVQSLRELQPNERTLFSALLWPFARLGVLDYMWLPLSVLCVVVTAVGSWRLAQLYIQPTSWALVATGLGLIGLYGYTLGNTALLNNNFQASGVADACAVWALWLSIRQRHWAACWLLVLATWLQPLHGTCLTVLVGCSWLGQVAAKQLSVRQLIGLAGGWLLLAGSYVVAIRLAYDSGPAQLTDAAFFQIVFQYRAPHHFLPSAFGLREWVITVPLLLVGLWWYVREKSPLVWLFTGYVGLATVYLIGVEGYQSFQVGSSQWFRITPVVALLGCIALGGIGAGLLPISTWPARRLRLLLLAGACVALGLVYVGHSWPWLRNRDYYLPGLRQRHPDYRLARWVDTHLPANALLVLPYDFNTLKYWGNRAAWVDYKGFARGRTLLPVWYARMKTVYGTTFETPIGSRREIAQHYLQQHGTDSLFVSLQHQGVTHLVADTALVSPHLSRLRTEGRWAVYALPPGAQP
jgi:hypothetical protein